MNSLLARQLRRLGLTSEEPPADAGAWQQLLERVARSYDDSDRSRYLLERSLHISSQEMRDVLDRLERTGRAREAEQKHRLRTVIDALDDGLCTLDPEGLIEFANPAAARMLETDLEDLIGCSILDRFCFWPDEPEESLSPERAFRVAASGMVFSDDTALLTRPGQEHLPVSCVMTPVGVEGEVRGVVFVFRDLTERHRTLDAARRSERHYRTLFHTIPIAVYEEDYSAVGDWLQELRASGVTDLGAYLDDNPDEFRAAFGLVQVIDVNPAALDLVDAEDASALIGPLRTETLAVETLAAWRQQLLALWEGRDSVHLELQGTTLTGKRLDAIFHLSISRVGGEQDLSKVLIALTDITKRKQIEDQLADLVRSKDEFVAAVSHELRTPLTAVYGSAALLRDSWDSLADAEKSELSGYIARESREITDLVEDLLVAARADMGSLSVSREVIALRAEVVHALDGLQRGTTGNPIDIAQVSGTAYADPLRLRQIVRNLLSNALRYGGDQITVRTEREGGVVVIRVSDNGDGIPKEDREAIFDAYHRAHRTAGTPGSVGLGLTVARRLAEMMDGDLTHRRSGSLTIFELRLPALPELVAMAGHPSPTVPPETVPETETAQPVRQA
jgi:PAS domain S-box-containing protein